jgi:hypothetical protein
VKELQANVLKEQASFSVIDIGVEFISAFVRGRGR